MICILSSIAIGAQWKRPWWRFICILILSAGSSQCLVSFTMNSSSRKKIVSHNFQWMKMLRCYVIKSKSSWFFSFFLLFIRLNEFVHLESQCAKMSVVAINGCTTNSISFLFFSSVIKLMSYNKFYAKSIN